jgi:cobalamin synthase
MDGGELMAAATAAVLFVGFISGVLEATIAWLVHEPAAVAVAWIVMVAEP